MEALAVCLIGLGTLALLGLQTSLVLAFGNHFLKSKHPACRQVIRSPYAHVGKIPVAHIAGVIYGGILGLVLQVLQHGQVFWAGISISVLFLIAASGVYAYLLFFKLRLVCMLCVRLYLINALMGIFLMGYHGAG